MSRIRPTSQPQHARQQSTLHHLVSVIQPHITKHTIQKTNQKTHHLPRINNKRTRKPNNQPRSIRHPRLHSNSQTMATHNYKHRSKTAQHTRFRPLPPTSNSTHKTTPTTIKQNHTTNSLPATRNTSIQRSSKTRTRTTTT